MPAARPGRPGNPIPIRAGFPAGASCPALRRRAARRWRFPSALRPGLGAGDRSRGADGTRRAASGRRSGDDAAARSPERRQAAGALAGPGPAATGTPWARVPGSWPRCEADQAVDALYYAHYRSLARIAALLVGDGAMAEEIVQDTFVLLHRAWPHLRDKDRALDHLRRAVVSSARSQSAASPDPPSRTRNLAMAGQLAPGTSGALLMAALRGLPARQREALVLKYYADWPDAQIAAAMGVSRHALNDCIRRGMSALQACAATRMER